MININEAMLTDVLSKAESGEELSRADVLALLSIEENSREYHELLGIADRDSRRRFCGRGKIFAQIGIEASPCPANCAFCSLAADVFHPDNSFILPISDAEKLTDQLVVEGIDELFLMTTANYGKDDYIKYASSIRKRLPDSTRFVANVGDFDLEYAMRLKDVGFTGAYHIRRFGEGVDTQLTPEQRIRTLDAVRDAGLELYYCVEPIGPEHTPDEIADEIFRAKNYPVEVMAVMKRVCVPGTKLYSRGEISAVTLAKICAVTELCVRPKRAMGVHEPDELCLVSGANQIYAELSVNPRDSNLQTERSRGASIKSAERLLWSAGWTI